MQAASNDRGALSGIRTNAAAELLGVSPNTLRSWERRFGYPTPRRTAGGHRQYDLSELEALRRALLETHNISSAIQVARQRGEGPGSAVRLLEAFDRFDEAMADRFMEDRLAQERVPRAMRALDPAALVLCGSGATLDVVGRLVYGIRQLGSSAPLFEYRGSMPVTGNHNIPSLGSTPTEATERLKVMLDRPAARPTLAPPGRPALR